MWAEMDNFFLLIDEGTLIKHQESCILVHELDQKVLEAWLNSQDDEEG